MQQEVQQEHENQDLMKAACAFWLKDNDQVRTPFPAEIHQELERNARDEYMKWVHNLTAKDRQEVDDDELVGVFEMFLFGEALKLVDNNDSDLLLTIHHPLMPRIDDVVNDEKRGPSKVTARNVEQKDDGIFMVVSLEVVESREAWQTEFLLPK